MGQWPFGGCVAEQLRTDTITEALLGCRDGDRDAFERLVTVCYGDLRKVAHRQLRRVRAGQTLNTTGLVHEAYLKLVDQARVEYQDRNHFYSIMARAMRQIIVDFARRRLADKRGGGQARVPLDESEIEMRADADQLVAVDEALARLASIDERLVRLVECRFFAGLTEEETAAALAVSRSTVQRDWLRARALLRKEMGSAPSPAGDG
jgi:RNA polymerase sigma factor (TIGR02999 family)